VSGCATAVARAKPAAVADRLDPHYVLAASAAMVLLLEVFRGSATVDTAPIWPIIQAAVAAVAFALAWRNQQRLRLAPIVAIGLGFHLAWITIHLGLGVQSDSDSVLAYPRAGDALLSGHYPSSEYPPGAVLLFALDSLLSGGGDADRVSHAFVMVPFQVATVVGVWLLKTRWSPWFAAVIALWPLNAFFWEFKFDAAPTAALVLGLVLGLRRRWAWAGVAFGLGAALKWSPALAALVLAVWLLGRREPRAAAVHVLSAAGTFILINLPFLIGWPEKVIDAYRLQGVRGITGESLYYIPLRLVHVVGPQTRLSHPIGAPDWANTVAIALQVSVLLAIVLAAFLLRDDIRSGLSLAAIAPAVFLLTNRVFSPQFLVMLLAAWVVAAALLARSAADQLGFGILLFAITLLNVLVYPTHVDHWAAYSALLFLLSFAATGWVLMRSLESARPPLERPSADEGVAGLR
jgi:hypothetical protein